MMWHVHEFHSCHFWHIKCHIFAVGQKVPPLFFFNLSGVWYVNCHSQINYSAHLQLKFVTNLTLKRLGINVEYTKIWLSTWNTKVGLETLRKKNRYKPKRWSHSFETHTNISVIRTNKLHFLSYFNTDNKDDYWNKLRKKVHLVGSYYANISLCRSI